MPTMPGTAPFNLASAARLWRAGYSTMGIAHALQVSEPAVWNRLDSIKIEARAPRPGNRARDHDPGDRAGAQSGGQAPPVHA